jgi:hypothetical protein
MLEFEGQESVDSAVEGGPFFVALFTGPSFGEGIDAGALLDEPLDHSVVVTWGEGGREGGREGGKVASECHDSHLITWGFGDGGRAGRREGGKAGTRED